MRYYDDDGLRFNGDIAMPNRHANAEYTPWYHVCATCTAKWFHAESVARCPRCLRRSQSGERINPPWRNASRHLELASSGLQERRRFVGG